MKDYWLGPIYDLSHEINDQNTMFWELPVRNGA